ncbi:MAG: hypothetical protein JWM68_3745 [Verrucomicrobiales bacterium]|nr:hypothetical protein [Verrucomicrobiales bacterium]
MNNQPASLFKLSSVNTVSSSGRATNQQTMKVETMLDQAECLEVITAMGIREVLKPLPPNKCCDGMLQLNDAGTSFLIATNNEGTYSLHLLTECDQGQAWEFHRTLNKKPVNPRLHYMDSQSVPANN